MNPQQPLIDWLEKHGWQDRLPLLEQYHNLLQAENSAVNLISRKQDPAQWWTLHLLDSLLMLEHFDLNGKNVLDWGTGGGLPGVPLAICCPAARFVLIDGTGKKIAAVSHMIEQLGLTNCQARTCRLEDIVNTRADIIVSRAVALEARYLPVIRRLLKRDGRLVLYRGPGEAGLDLLRAYKNLPLVLPGAEQRRLVVATASQL